MRLFGCLMIVLVTGFTDTSGEERSPIEPRITRIENRLTALTAPIDMLRPRHTEGGQFETLAERMAHYRVPGVSIAVVDGNEIEWARAYGAAKTGGDNAVTTETLFEAASTTKLIVSAIALHYVEQGLLDLDADVNEKLRSWHVPENPFTDARPVTLRLLLTHQAGLNRPDGGFSWADGSVPTLLQTLDGAAPAENDPAAIEYEPGSKWQYSNFGYLVIQQLLEDVIGEPFAAIARRVVFEPLGMSSSTFELPLDPEMKARTATPHDAEGIPREHDLHPRAVANGGLMTTPTDLAIFANELMLAYRGDSNRILSRSMTREMLRRGLELDPALLGVPLGEGLGVLLFGTGDDFYFLHPGDNLPGATSWLLACPARGKGMVIMTNGAMGNLLALEISAALIDEYHWPDALEVAD